MAILSKKGSKNINGEISCEIPVTSVTPVTHMKFPSIGEIQCKMLVTTGITGISLDILRSAITEVQVCTSSTFMLSPQFSHEICMLSIVSFRNLLKVPLASIFAWMCLLKNYLEQAWLLLLPVLEFNFSIFDRKKIISPI